MNGPLETNDMMVVTVNVPTRDATQLTVRVEGGSARVDGLAGSGATWRYRPEQTPTACAPASSTACSSCARLGRTPPRARPHTLSPSRF